MGLHRRWIFRLLALAIALAGGLAVAEVALRVTPLPGSGFRGTAVDGKAERRAAIGPDFRGTTPVLEKPPGTYRILVVGDSYAWGDGVERHDAFPNRLEQMIAPRVDWARLEVLNWSRPGWNTVHQMATLRRSLDTLAPDLVLWTFVLNDAEPVNGQERFELQREVAPGPYNPHRIGGGWWSGHSRVAAAVAGALENIRMRRALDRYYRSLYGDQPGWRAAKRALKKMRVELRRRRVPLALIVFPVFDSQFDHRYRYRDLHLHVVETAESLGIPVLDLLPAYEGIDARRLAVEPFTDPHPNELGHRIAAQAIFDYLAAWKVIRPPAPQPP